MEISSADADKREEKRRREGRTSRERVTVKGKIEGGTLAASLLVAKEEISSASRVKQVYDKGFRQTSEIKQT